MPQIPAACPLHYDVIAGQRLDVIVWYSAACGLPPKDDLQLQNQNRRVTHYRENFTCNLGAYSGPYHDLYG